MEINEQEQYDQERFDNAIGTKSTFLSNHEQLQNPIVDKYGNKFYNAEGYYMSLRTESRAEKEGIAWLFFKKGRETKPGPAAREARQRFKLDKDKKNRVEYMRQTIKEKFNRNPKLAAELFVIREEIIEKNWWNDTLFGVNDKTLQGANILGKLLMEYRDANNRQNKGAIG